MGVIIAAATFFVGFPLGLRVLAEVARNGHTKEPPKPSKKSKPNQDIVPA